MELIFDGQRLSDSVKYKRVFKDRITVNEMCSKVGVSRATLHRLEHGKEIDISTFVKLCNYTEVSPAVYFVTNKNK